MTDKVNFLKSFGDLSIQEQSDQIMEAKRLDEEEARARANLKLLYGFDPSDSGLRGYTRLPNLVIDSLYKLKAVNIETGKSIENKKGEKLYRHVLHDKKTKKLIKDEAKSLEALDLLVLIQLLSTYQYYRNPDYVSCSQTELAERLGKSFSAIHAVFKKLELLGYIIKSERRRGLPEGGHVRIFSIRPFLLELQKVALQKQAETLDKEKEARGTPFGDFSGNISV